MNRSLIEVFLIWVLGFGILFFITKSYIARFFIKKSRLPVLVNYIIIAIPVCIIEEYLTYEQSMLYSLLVIIPIFLVFLVILFFIQKKFKMHYIYASLIFGLFGSFNEMILSGRLVALLPQLPIFIIILIALLAVLIYFVIALLPTYYLYFTLKSTSKR